MTAPIRLQEVALVQIDLDEAALELVAAPDLDRLRISLREVGLFEPSLAEAASGRTALSGGYRDQAP